jgi:hypothetical protein
MSETSSAQHPPAGKGGNQAPQNFAALARRMASWATNGLATALVLVAGFALGRQVLVWWGETPPQPLGAPDGQPSGAVQQQLEFGALATTMRTRPIRGNRDEVVKQLIDLCRPIGRPQTSADDHVSAAERRLLADLALREPAAAGDGWRIDELAEQMPLVVCSTWAGTKTVKRNSSRSRSGTNPVLPVPLDLRIVSIAMAIPADNGAWSGYVFDVSDPLTSPVIEEGPALPPNSRRVLTLRQDDGSVMRTFRGLAEPDAWEKHFGEHDSGSGWRLISGSQSAGGRWQGEFTRPGEKPLRAIVHFEYDGQGWLHGLSLVAPDRQP